MLLIFKKSLKNIARGDNKKYSYCSIFPNIDFANKTSEINNGCSCIVRLFGANIFLFNSTIIFFFNGFINLAYVLILFVGLFCGSFLGSKFAPRIGNEWIKRGFIVIVFIMAIKLLLG